MYHPFGGCLSLKEITIKRADKEAFRNLASSKELGDDETEYLGLFGSYWLDSYCSVYVPDPAFLAFEDVCYSENVLILPESMRGHTILDGDVNGDNEVTIADAVMLQNYLFGKTTDILWYNADIISEFSDMISCKFGQIDVFDLIELKKKLLTATNQTTDNSEEAL